MNVWRTVLINNVLHDLYELANLRTTWPARNAPLNLMVGCNYGMDTRTDGFLLDSYRDKLDELQTPSYKIQRTVSARILHRSRRHCVP